MSALILAAMAAAAVRTAPDAAVGEWFNEDGLGKVAVAPCAGDPSRLCGAINWLKDPVGHPTRDVHNSDAALRNRPLIGLLVIRDMKNEGPGRWGGGKVYDPEKGKAYDGKLRVLDPKTLKVTGCVLMICESETWRRAD